MNKILIVDDEQSNRAALRRVLEMEGFMTLEAPDGLQAVELFRKELLSAVILDLKMPGIDGIETMKMCREINHEIPIIILTAFGDISTAVEAIKLGAYDFIEKPFNPEKLTVVLKRGVEKFEMQGELKRLNTEAETSLEWMLGRSDKMRVVIEQIRQISKTDFTVIIQGETGVGKSFIASIIHNFSSRAHKPFVKVDLATIPETLIESELFGSEKGAFTGADKRRKGLLESANGGTMFIDELENMSSYAQSKFLTVIEEKKIHSLGSVETKDIDVRIISATNVDIKKALTEKNMRMDLFYRLSEFMITIPPLRERVDDIPFLVQKFLIEAETELNAPAKTVNEDIFEVLGRYPWPGNVRELRNIIRRAVLVSDDHIIKRRDIEFLLEDTSGDVEFQGLLPLKELVSIAVKELEKKAIKKTLELTKGNKSKAALLLQVDYKTILTKIKEYKLS